MNNYGPNLSSCRQTRLWSADLSLRLAHISFCWLWLALAQIVFDVWMLCFWKMCQCNMTFDLTINLDHSDLYFTIQQFFVFLAHLSRRLTRWAYRMGLEPASVRPCVRACVHTFKHEYLRDQQADYNQILSEASLGWGKGCIRVWCRSDQNSGFHGNG